MLRASSGGCAIRYCLPYTTSPNVASLALAFAASHAMELGQDIVEKVRRTLLQLANDSNANDVQVRATKIEEMILSAALYLYRGVAPTESPFRFIGELRLELAKISSTCAELSRGMVDRLVEALPSADSRHLWKLQVYIRSVSTKAETTITTAVAGANSEPAQ